MSTGPLQATSIRSCCLLAIRRALASHAVCPLAPLLRGEGWGEGQTHGKCSWKDLYPLTRIASDDAIRPVSASEARRAPASGARLNRARRTRCAHFCHSASDYWSRRLSARPLPLATLTADSI